MRFGISLSAASASNILAIFEWSQSLPAFLCEKHPLNWLCFDFGGFCAIYEEDGSDWEQRIRFLLPLGLPLSSELFSRAVTWCRSSFLSFLVSEGCPTASDAYYWLFKINWSRVRIGDVLFLASLGVPTVSASGAKTLEIAVLRRMRKFYRLRRMRNR